MEPAPSTGSALAVKVPAIEGRTYENFVLEHLVTALGLVYVRPIDVHGFKVDIGLVDYPGVVIECKNRLDSHQSHRACAAAWTLQHNGWRGCYIVVAPALPVLDSVDRMVLDSATASKAISHVLVTGTDPTAARIDLAALLCRYSGECQ